ncbi:putative holin-like toxin [Leuconostoc mesenteroides]|nr:putative holin-like toxin [Leuconostoc mesenteroides]
MSVSDTLQLMIGFGTFVLILVGLVVELIKNSNKKRSSCFSWADDH